MCIRTHDANFAVHASAARFAWHRATLPRTAKEVVSRD